MTLLRLTALAGAMLVAACSGSVGGATGSKAPAATSPGSTVAPASRPGPTPSPTADPAIVQAIAMGEPVYGIASAGATVWVEGNSRLHQLDAATGEVLREMPGWWPTVAGGSLWYLRDEALVEADPATGEERSAYETGALGTAVADGVQWAADWERHRLFAFDLARSKVVHVVELPPGEPKWVQPWEGVIWVMLDGSGGVALRVDAESGEIIDTVDAGSRPHSVALGFGSLWVTDHGTANVVRFAPDGKLQATIEGPGLNVAIAATEDAIWAATATGLVRIDPETNTVAGEVRLGPGDWYGMVAASGYLWLTSAEDGHVFQIKPPG